MKKNLHLFKIFVLLLIPQLLHAQTGERLALSIGSDLLLPFNSSEGYHRSDAFYRLGLGLFAKAELPLTGRLKLTFSTGYLGYVPTNKDYFANPVLYTCANCTVPNYNFTPDNPVYQYVPVKAGLRYYLSGFYLEAEGGAAFGVGGKATSSVLYAGGAGWVLRFNRHNAIDLGVCFQRAFTSTDYNYLLSQADIRIAYRYAF
jgi:hypothetical protein